MKKSLIASAVAAGMLATGAAQADPQVYGIINLFISSYADDHYSAPGGSPSDIVKTKELTLNSNTSAIGVKGSEDLGNGLKAIYKLEWQVDPSTRNNGTSQASLIDRDQWLGLKGGWGKVAFGTMSSNYKQMGGKIDPLYRTEAEARGILNMHSSYHKGAGIDGGRMTKAVQYTTPKMAGIEVVVNTTLSGVGAGTSTADEAIGVGVRWSNKSFLAFFDYFDPSSLNPSAQDESIMKVGGKWSGKAFQVSGQYEMVEDQLTPSGTSGGDYIFLNGLWNINKNNLVTLSVGQQDKVSQSYALGYVHKMSKQTNVYVGYGTIEEDSAGSAVNLIGLKEDGTTHDKGTTFFAGLRKSF